MIPRIDNQHIQVSAMFERLLERVLQRSLGKYIEDLDRKHLSISVWSGQIELENLNLKKNLIEKLRLPVNLLMGKIGKLKINVPWNQLSSKPVEVVIESVNVVVTPKGRNEWTDNADTITTNEEKRKKFLDTFTRGLFNELIKAKEVIEKEQGMLARVGTRTVDNLQVQIQNLHVRIESNNAHFSDDLFSMGMTLEQLKIHTTNEDWEIEFLDRTKKEQARLPLHKILVIENFGVYYKPKDLYFVADLPTEEQRIAQLNQLFPAGTSKIAHYADSYLLEPVKLITKLKLEPEHDYRATVALDIENVEICMQKNQLVNILRLIELDQQYTKKQERFQFLKQQEYVRRLTQLKDELEIDDAGVKELFTRHFLSRPGADKIFIENASSGQDDQGKGGGADDNEPTPLMLLSAQTLQTEGLEDCFNSFEEAEQFEVMLMGVTIETQKEWLTAISKDKAKDYLNRVSHQQQVADSKKGLRSYFKSFFYAGPAPSEQEASTEMGDSTTPAAQAARADNDDSAQQALTEGDDEFQDALDTQTPMVTAKSNHGGDDDFESDDDEFQDALENEDLLMQQLEQQFNPAEQEDSSPAKEKAAQPEDMACHDQKIALAEQQVSLQVDSEAEPEMSRINADFRLGKFSLTLMYDHVERSGIQILMQEFCILFNKFDSQQARCMIAHELRARNEVFGIYSFDANDHKVAILEQYDAPNQSKTAPFQAEESKDERNESFEVQTSRQVLELILIKHNILADPQAQPSSALKLISKERQDSGGGSGRDLSIDMDISVVLQPIKLIYRPAEIEKLVNFFYVEDLRPEMRKKAQNFKRSLTQRLDSHVKQSIEMHELRKRKNKVRVEVTCPVLEVPFSNNPHWIDERDSQQVAGKINVEEKWVIAMGDLLLTNYQPGAIANTVREHGDVTQAQTHKNFLLRISNSYFKYQKGAVVGQPVAEPAQVIGDFNMDLLVSVRKKAFESQAVQLPKLRISGKMSDLCVSLTPYTYCNFTQIHRLFYGEQAAGAASESVANNPLSLFKLSNKAGIQGNVSKQGQALNAPESFYALLHQEQLLFYSDESDDISKSPGEAGAQSASAEEGKDGDGGVCSDDDKVNAAMDRLFAERDYYINEGSTDRAPVHTFSLHGCSIMSSSRQTLSLANERLETCVLSFKSAKQMTAWKEAIESCVKQIQITAGAQAKVGATATASDKHSPFEVADSTEMGGDLAGDALAAPEDQSKAEDGSAPVQQHLILKSIISFEVPSIKVILAAERADLDPEKGVFDPYDAGLFKSRDSEIDSWKLVVDTKKWKIESIKRTDDSDLRVSLEQFQVLEVQKAAAQSERFPWLLKTNDQGFSVDINRCTRGTEVYQNVDMTVTFVCGAMQANWKPKAINRLLRFLRFKNFKRYAFKNWLSQALFRFKQMKLIKKDKEHARAPQTSSGPHQIPHQENLAVSLEAESAETKKQIKNCETDPQVLMRILVKIDSLQIKCLHPQNDSYPIFSALSENFSFDYKMLFDHDTHNLVMQTLEVQDHTQYPNTLDPTVLYPADAHMESNKILMRKLMPSKGQNMLEMQILMFHFPMERTCPKSWLDENKQHDKFVKMQLRCCRLNFIQEYLYRLYEYFYSQILGALSDSNPYLEGRKKADATFRELIILAKKTASPLMMNESSMQDGGGGDHDFEQLDPLTLHPYWTILNAHIFSELQQSPFCTGLDIRFEHPLVILKDRFYKDKGEIQAHFSQVHITAETAKKKGRYRKQPGKAIDTSSMIIKCKGLSLLYSQSNTMKQRVFTVLPPTSFMVEKEAVTWSPMLDKRMFLTPGFDFADLDFAQYFRIKCDPIKLTMVQEVFTYFMQCSDLNLNFVDGNQKQFQLGIWDDPDSQKFLRLEEETKKKYRDHAIVYKQKVEIVIPSLSMVLLSSDDLNLEMDAALIAELVFWNFRLEMLRFHDGRKKLDLTSHSLQVLRNMPQQSNLNAGAQNGAPELTEIREERTSTNASLSAKDQLKAVLMGHMSASNVIFANDDFYRFNVDKIIRSDESLSQASSQNQSQTHRQRATESLAESVEGRRGRLGNDIAKEKRFKRRKDMLLKNNFQMIIDMFPSGEKIYKINLEQPKVLARADIFLMVGDFFRSGFPQYTLDTFDKPNGWTDDPNSARRQEIVVEMRQALVYFENEELAKTTVVCSGDMFLTKNRENINQVKLKLLDRMDKTLCSVTQTQPGKQMKLNTARDVEESKQSQLLQEHEESKGATGASTTRDEVKYDYSSKTNMMLIHLQNFCPYFCSTEDLNGKQLKELKKREIMQPFDVHLQVTHMIELVRQGPTGPGLGPQLQNESQYMVFKKYKKTETSLDWTLLKLSFHDLQIFKQIFAHNVSLIKKRSEKMALLAEEEEEASAAVDGLSHGASSNLSDTEEEFQKDVSPDMGKFRPTLVAEIHQPIGPALQRPVTLQIKEPSLHESASFDGFSEVISAAEEGHIGHTSAMGVKESRRTMRQSQQQTRQRNTSFQSGVKRTGENMLLDPSLLNPIQKRASQSRKITNGSGSSNSRKLRANRSIQEFTSLDNAKDMISSILKPKSDIGQRNKESQKMSSSSAGSISENLQGREEPVVQNNAFYFVRRSSLRMEATKANKKRRQQMRLNESRVSASSGGSYALNRSNIKQEDSDDEANAGIEDSTDHAPPSDKLMHEQPMLKKTKTLVELTSRTNAVRITEEDTDDEGDANVSDDEEEQPCHEIYNDLRAIGIAQLEKYSDFKVLQVVEEELGNNILQVVSYGMQFIIINDYSGNYLPVFGVSLSELNYQFGMTANLREGNTDLQLSASYFNAKQGCWEPIVEHFAVEMLYSKQEKSDSKDVQLSVQEELNLNVTESLLQTIRDTYRTIKTQREQALEEKEAQQKHVLMTSRSLNITGGLNSLSRSIMDFELLDHEEETKGDGNDWDRSQVNKNRHKALISDKDAVVSPFAIRNLTEAEIVIKKQLTKQEIQRREYYAKRKSHLQSQTYREQSILVEPLQDVIEEGTETQLDVDSESESIAASEMSVNTSLTVPPTEGISRILEGTYKDSRYQRQQMLMKSQHYTTRKPFTEKREFKTVLKVDTCETKDYKINYDLQIEKQIASFKDINLSERLEEIIWVNFGSKSKTDLEDINLNKSMKPCRHQFANKKYKEFIVYSIEFENMKRVLTLRTQYLMFNKTLHDYHINIISLLDPNKQEMKLLKAGQSLPIPESYNQCAMQLKPARESSDLDWSDKWQIYALKKVVEIDQPGYLKHGSTYTYFRKQMGQAQDTFDICLMPPLVLLNCLPVELKISFIDINGKRQRVTLQREETRNIFDFDLQAKINLMIQIDDDGYSPAALVLDTEKKIRGEEEKINLCMKDQALRRLYIRVKISQKTAGFKVCFYNANCLINNTDKDLLFFYREPSREAQIYEADRDIMVSEPIASQQNLYESYGTMASSRDDNKIESVVHMLSSTKEVYAKIDGSTDVSSPIVTFTHGSRGQFTLLHRNKLLEFCYFTNLYRCHATENLYTKITTVQPRYMVINYTQSTLICAQEDSKGNPLIIKSGKSQPFHWSNQNCAKLMSVQIMPRESQFASSQYDWSVGFNLEHTGSLTLTNRERKEEHFIAMSARAATERQRRTSEQDSGFFSFFNRTKQAEKKPQVPEHLLPICKASKRLLRINRKMHQQQMLVIVEEEEEELPDMRIENKCDNICIVYQQEGNKKQEEVDLLDKRESQAFAWSDPNESKVLQLQFFRNSFQFPSEQQLCGGDTNHGRNKALIIEDRNSLDRIDRFSDHMTISFDKLNQEKRQIFFPRVGPSFKKVYLSIVTNGFTRILRFDNVPPVLKTVHQKREDEEQELLKRTQKVVRFRVFVQQVNVSICTTGKELMTVYLSNIILLLTKTQQESSVAFNMKSIQIDNQSEQDPVYPVILMPTDLRSVIQQPQGMEGQDWDLIVPEDVFQLRVTMRHDLPNVLYFKHVAFLVQRLDIKMELAHVMLLYQFFKSVSKIFNKNLVTQHKIFQNSFQVPMDSLASMQRVNSQSSMASGLQFGNTPGDGQQTERAGQLLREPTESSLNDQRQGGGGREQQQASPQITNTAINEQEETVTAEDDADEEFFREQRTNVNTMRSDSLRQVNLDQKLIRSHALAAQPANRQFALLLPNKQTQQQQQQQKQQSLDYLEEYQKRVRSRNTLVGAIRERNLRKQQKDNTNKTAGSRIEQQKLQRITEESRLERSDLLDDDARQESEDDEEIELVKREYGVKRIYIEKFFSSPFALRISLMKQGQIENEKALEEIAFVKKVANIGLSIISLDKTPIYLNAFEICNVYGDMADITSQFKDYYKTQLKSNTLRLFGGANLFGNPVGFIGTVGSGFKDFYYEPAKGFHKSYRDGGYGLAKGTGSLLRNTVGGTIGSLGKVSSSIGSALLYLTGDQQFRENRSRQMIKQAPKGVLSGMSSGIGTALDSTISGIRGVVSKPTEGYRTSGASGMALGALQGVAGLLVKPVAGAMDLVSKTSQGIEASASTEAQKNEARMRPPRAFYGKEKVIRNFDIDHAELLQITPKLKYRLPELPDSPLTIDMNFFIDAWIIEKGTRSYDWSILITTSDQMIRINRYATQTARQLDMQANDRLSQVFFGNGLIQISSVNSFSQCQSIDLHENRMFDIVFEDNRELFVINDTKVAEKIKKTLDSLHNDVKKVKLETQTNQSSLSYNTRAQTMLGRSQPRRSTLR